MSLQTWLLYTVAVFVLTVTPGPSVLMCVSNGVNHGVRRTFFSAIGSVTAVVGIMVCSAIGVGAVLAASETLFHAIKWFGVCYLLYIGITTLRSTTSSFELPSGTMGRSSRKALYAKGFLVGASNPKALLFFTAFFPQFINPASPQLYQFAILGGTFICFELFWLMSYAAFASRLSPWLRVKGRAKAFNRLSGLTFIGAGALLATVKRAAKDV
ncbi:LysE family translocator [Variovorax sp. Sphag1AA]|uniref:LysE family translocator n=1 Tax=Variovorax sp. Sphag1AA TaxID=2587027 RepID=UPI0016202A2A|nr:LysE family translocator [Variovorax sp. Sphag1AA]MBB3176847.1 threonine/homoserine/homoserine lactone efflux protein [Variovorax sp. Sphag1AA]